MVSGLVTSPIDQSRICFGEARPIRIAPKPLMSICAKGVSPSESHLGEALHRSVSVSRSSSWHFARAKCRKTSLLYFHVHRGELLVRGLLLEVLVGGHGQVGALLGRALLDLLCAAHVRGGLADARGREVDPELLRGA